MGTMKKMGTVAGLAAVAAGAYYFYYGKNAKQNRKAAVAWMGNAEKEVMVQVRKLKDAALDEKNYKKIISTVAAKYKKLKKLEEGEVEDFIGALEAAWNKVKKDIVAGKKKIEKMTK